MTVVVFCVSSESFIVPCGPSVGSSGVSSCGPDFAAKLNVSASRVVTVVCPIGSLPQKKKYTSQTLP